MILVTGGYGFIGSNLIKKLNSLDETNILVVDDLEDGKKFKNLIDCQISDFVSIECFYKNISKFHINQIFHQGAISSTTEWDGNKIMKYNFEYSKLLFHYALEKHVPFKYASSAAVYGNSFPKEKPLTVYGYSKLLFDQYVNNHKKHITSKDCVQGFRYFNVYGNNELHKGNQASPISTFCKQAKESKTIKIFKNSENCIRDFIYVGDVVNILTSINCSNSGIYDLGTENPLSFFDVANIIKEKHNATVEIVPFPDHLKNYYQYYTCADNTSLYQTLDYKYPFETVENYILSTVR